MILEGYVEQENMNRSSRLFLLAGLSAVALTLSACGTTTQDTGGIARITKVNPYHLKQSEWTKTEDRMIAFEQAHRYHGAITAEEYRERYGYYFTIFWKTDAPGSPNTVRLEYTQANTGATVHVKEVPIDSPKGRNTTEITVVGEDYLANGPVTSWKASVLSGEEVIADYRSFLWK